MKLHYQKRGGLLDASLSCAVDTSNQKQLTEAESKDFEQLLILSQLWTLKDFEIQPKAEQFSYVLSVETPEQTHSVRFSSGSYADNPYLWRIVDLVELLCYRACAAEERPHQSAACCSGSDNR